VAVWRHRMHELNPTSTSTDYVRSGRTTSAALDLTITRDWLISVVHSVSDATLSVAVIRAEWWVTKVRP